MLPVLDRDLRFALAGIVLPAQPARSLTISQALFAYSITPIAPGDRPVCSNRELARHSFWPSTVISRPYVGSTRLRFATIGYWL